MVESIMSLLKSWIERKFAQKTDIPTKISELTNDNNYITNSYHDSTKQNVLTTTDKQAIADLHDDTEINNKINSNTSNITELQNEIKDISTITTDSDGNAIVGGNVIIDVGDELTGINEKIDNLPTSYPTPNKLIFTGVSTGEFDGSSALSINIPEIAIKPFTLIQDTPAITEEVNGFYNTVSNDIQEIILYVYALPNISASSGNYFRVVLNSTSVDGNDCICQTSTALPTSGYRWYAVHSIRVGDDMWYTLAQSNTNTISSGNVSMYSGIGMNFNDGTFYSKNPPSSIWVGTRAAFGAGSSYRLYVR